ncbi:MAG TPA: hypothetical protein VHB98_12630 [Chloroflexota bacterium]|nr:hypothetical protein [Chloroflexota bacterium]
MPASACTANMGWTLWACIQQSISALDVDFWSYAMTRWERAQAVVEAPDFDRLLAACKSQ